MPIESRRFISAILYTSILAQFAGALIILPLTLPLIAFSGAIIGVGVFFFRWMADYGVRRVEWLVREGLADRPAG